MPSFEATACRTTAARLHAISGLSMSAGAPLSRHTRFGIGGPARYFVEASGEDAFTEALRAIHQSGCPHAVIGGGTNLVVSDEGFGGFVLRFTAAGIEQAGVCLRAAAGGDLQALVDFSIARGLRGLETMTGIPGSVGGAIYGNAGAYGRAICKSVRQVRVFDGAAVRALGNAECQFRYRESIFKRNRNWVILSAELALEPAPPEELARVAGEILTVRNRKYPPTMKCAGSIFKNLILAELSEPVRARVPANVAREGKVPSAWFLEQAGAKGLRRGDIQVADYHANLIYNAGAGTAAEVREVIRDLKSRVWDMFGLELEEEVQYIGFGETIALESA
ncbi:MAG: UDP-N-acetylmuramate dehydrogenase [Bryobacteraceae bacterium]|jgi:UDP-N-acetylmuramate dehydrogenase